jgi:hypothetical protein
MDISVIRPGLLVSLKTTVRGGIAYLRRDVEPVRKKDGAQISTWETTRTITDVEEWDAAIKTRAAARALVTRVCCPSEFGLLCPAVQEDQLSAGVAAARVLADAHNATAKWSRIEIYILTGRVEQDDVEASRAIAAEVRGMIDAMGEGIKAADPVAIREAANKARALGGMLSAAAQEKVSSAILQARAAAREIVKRVTQDGEAAAIVVTSLKLDAIESARFAFLDLEKTVCVAAPDPVAPEVEI